MKYTIKPGMLVANKGGVYYPCTRDNSRWFCGVALDRGGPSRPKMVLLIGTVMLKTIGEPRIGTRVYASADDAGMVVVEHPGRSKGYSVGVLAGPIDRLNIQALIKIKARVTSLRVPRKVYFTGRKHESKGV